MAILSYAGGKNIVLDNADIWGLRCALTHGILDGYFHENQEWAEKMKQRLDSVTEEEELSRQTAYDHRRNDK